MTLKSILKTLELQIASREAMLNEEMRQLTQFNAHESQADLYRGEINGLRYALDILRQKGGEE